MTQSPALPPLWGFVVSSYGRHYSVQLPDGSISTAYPKGKQLGVCVGDWVQLSQHASDQYRIDACLPRRNVLYRSDQMRSKQFAANIDQLFFVLATEPQFSATLLNRALIGAQAAGIGVYVLLNKVDLRQHYDSVRDRLQSYVNGGLQIIETSIHDPAGLRAQLLPLLRARCTLLLGQSGMGKSSLLNMLVPRAQAHTQTHSQALGTGKHTTTRSTVYALPHDIEPGRGGVAPLNHAQLAEWFEQHYPAGAIIDSPGFQHFGLHHLRQDDLWRYFPEVAQWAQQCRFHNCQHHKEPACAVQMALSQGDIDPERFAFYQTLKAECGA